jgi:hypothetical protein
MRSSLAALLGLFLAAPLAAQTVVPVEAEPFHRTAMMTPAARILDIRMSPGDSTAYHRHSRPYFWVVVKGDGFFSQLPGAAATPVAFVPGHVGFTAATGASPLVHRVLEGTHAAFQLVSAELDPAFGGQCAARAPEATPAGAQLLFDTLGVGVYRLHLAPGQAVAAGSRGAQLWISIDGGSLAWTPRGAASESASVLVPGQFIWEEHRSAFRNSGAQPMDAVVIRWRECRAS